MITPAQFAILMAPGLRHRIDEAFAEHVKWEEEMAIMYPDTHKIPIWRRQPTRLEHPITAWRIWGVRKDQDNKWILSSVAADCPWEGPVLRSDARPIDPKLWDKDRDALHHVFATAGIHAVKTREQAVDLAGEYSVSVFGEIALWGRVAQFTLGYRGEVCMVKKLFVLPTVRRLFNVRNDGRDETRIAERIAGIAENLEDRYDCEVVLV